MSTFHRWNTPSYYGGLPSGYDLINVVSGGTGSSGSAFADGAKSGSNPNTGTYFVAWGEDATSSNANRGMLALSQNTDLLDNLLHQDLAYAVRTNDTTGGSPVSTVVLPTNTFIGTTGYTTSVSDLKRLFEILDMNNDEIIDPSSGQQVQVTSVTLGSGDVIGGTGGNGSFSGNTVTLNISPSIPTGVTYRIWYASRTNLATLPMDALTTIKIRTAEEISAGVENLFRLLHGNNEAWNASWDSTIWDLALSGLNERYNRASSTNPSLAPEAYYPTVANGYGSGAWFLRIGPALTGYSGNSAAYSDPMNALFVSKSVDTSPSLSGGNTGFVAFGSRLSGTSWTGESGYIPGAATFMSLWPHYFQSSIHATNPYTRIFDGATAAFSLVGAYVGAASEAIVQVTQFGNYFRDAGGNAAIALGYDLLECTYMVSGVALTQTFVIVAMGSSLDPTNVTKVRVRSLDGSVPNFSAGYTGTIRWMSLSFGVGDGAGVEHAVSFSDVAPVLFDGLFYQVPPALSQSSDDNVTRVPPSFSAQNTLGTSPALSWGGFSHSLFGPVFNSYLQGDGGITINAVNAGAAINMQNGNINLTNPGAYVGLGAVRAVSFALGSLPFQAGVTTIGPLVSGGTLAVFNVAINSYRYLTVADIATHHLTVQIDVQNPRIGTVLVFTIDHTVYSSGSLTLDWTNGGTSATTNRFALGDDQPATGGGRTMWTGIAISSTEIWWTVTRSSIGLLEAVSTINTALATIDAAIALLAPLASPSFTGTATFAGLIAANGGATFTGGTVTLSNTTSLIVNGSASLTAGLAVTKTGGVPLVSTATGSSAAIEALNGPILVVGTGGASLAGTPQANAIYGVSFDKANANIRSDGAGGVAAATGGLNVNVALATEPVHSYSAVHVTFKQGMTDGDYAPDVQVIGWYGTITAMVSSTSNAGFYVTFWQFQQPSLSATGADVLIDPATTALNFAVRVAGTQP